MHVVAHKLSQTYASRRWTYLQAVTRCVVACCVFLSAGSLFASCGDYLFRNGKPVSGHSTSVMGQDAVFSAGRRIGEAPPQNSVPICSGPNCSSRPFSHFPASQIPRVLVKGFRAECVLESMTEQQQPSKMLENPQSERGAFFEPLPIFRPPAA